MSVTPFFCVLRCAVADDAAIDHFLVGIELIGSRFDDRSKAGLYGSLADNFVTGGYIYGGPFTLPAKPQTAFTLEEKLALETLDLTPTESVTYYAFVEDNFPGGSRRIETDLRFIDIRPFKRTYKLVEGAGGENTPRFLEELIARQRFNLNRTVRLAKHRRGDRTAPEDPLKIASFKELIAALTRRFAELTEGTPARILDTRKTTPGLRAREKYAVRCGGGTNHRAGLYDGILIKDNHIEVAGGIAEALAALNGHAGSLPVEIEADKEIAIGMATVLESSLGPVTMSSTTCGTQVISFIPLANGDYKLKYVVDKAAKTCQMTLVRADGGREAPDPTARRRAPTNAASKDQPGCS